MPINFLKQSYQIYNLKHKTKNHKKGNDHGVHVFGFILFGPIEQKSFSLGIIKLL